MKKERIGVGSRMLIGGIAGVVGTLAMTAAMRRMHEKLPAKERYPLTPREIVDSVAEQAEVPLGDEAAKDVTTAAHFAYGAASGALLGVANVMLGPVSGGLAGIGVWLGSYMGWIPAAGILKPATRHPPRRNLLMLGAHVVWGVATARAMRELVEARENAFGSKAASGESGGKGIITAGPDEDVPARDRPEA